MINVSVDIQTIHNKARVNREMTDATTLKEHIKNCTDINEGMRLLAQARTRLKDVTIERLQYEIVIAQNAPELIAKFGQREFNKLARSNKNIYPFIVMFDVLNDPEFFKRLDNPTRYCWIYNGHEIGEIDEIIESDGNIYGGVHYSYKGILTQLGKMCVNGVISRDRCRELLKQAITDTDYLRQDTIIDKLKMAAKRPATNIDAEQYDVIKWPGAAKKGD